MKLINNVVILSQLVRHLSAVHITVQSLYIFQLKLFTYCNTIKSESLYILSNTTVTQSLCTYAELYKLYKYCSIKFGHNAVQNLYIYYSRTSEHTAIKNLNILRYKGCAWTCTTVHSLHIHIYSYKVIIYTVVRTQTAIEGPRHLK